MSDETSKAIIRRLHSPSYATRYFVGNGIDIGAGADGLGNYRHLFPLMVSCRSWDLTDGDAQYMSGVADATYDFVHSSHCLEHMLLVPVALNHWWRILKPGGHLIVMVPEWSLYEHETWPSQFNSDHKHAFTVPMVFQQLQALRPLPIIHKVELLDHTYDYGAALHLDQTRGLAEAAIEFICRKPCQT